MAEDVQRLWLSLGLRVHRVLASRPPHILLLFIIWMPTVNANFRVVSTELKQVGWAQTLGSSWESHKITVRDGCWEGNAGPDLPLGKGLPRGGHAWVRFSVDRSLTTARKMKGGSGMKRRSKLLTWSIWRQDLMDPRLASSLYVTKMTLNVWFAFLCFLSSWITGVCHHAWVEPRALWMWGTHTSNGATSLQLGRDGMAFCRISGLCGMPLAFSVHGTDTGCGLRHGATAE